MVSTVFDYLDSLAWESAPELSWARLDFDVRSLRFVSQGAAAGGSLRLSRYQNPSTGQYSYWLWRNGHRAAVDPRWGRFAVLHASGIRVIEYDPRSCDLKVPRAVPLFRLLARALALCSGYASRYEEAVDSHAGNASHGYNVYAHIPPDVYEAVAAKVGQTSVMSTGGA
jgi:hypothetical protein